MVCYRLPFVVESLPQEAIQNKREYFGFIEDKKEAAPVHKSRIATRRKGFFFNDTLDDDIKSYQNEPKMGDQMGQWKSPSKAPKTAKAVLQHDYLSCSRFKIENSESESFPLPYEYIIYQRLYNSKNPPKFIFKNDFNNDSQSTNENFKNAIIKLCYDCWSGQINFLKISEILNKNLIFKEVDLSYGKLKRLNQSQSVYMRKRGKR